MLMELVEREEGLHDIWVRGEVTNCSLPASGHLFFARADAESLIPCVMWRSDVRRLEVRPRDGMDVLVCGSVSVYAQAGRYQLYVRELVGAGEGEKHLLLERWKRELSAEGHFAAERKRPLPRYPERIAVVTSESGAVLHDIVNVISRRYPLEIIVSPTAVQGEDAHLQIAAAIRRADGLADIMIVGRGGGSFEDLFPFNHPDVVRAIASCRTVVVSAVGHDVDVTLADHAADLRAPTPSAAAELAVPDRRELIAVASREGKALEGAVIEAIEDARSEIEDHRMRLAPKKMTRRIAGKRQELADLSERLFHVVRSVGAAVTAQKARMDQAVLARIRYTRIHLGDLRVRIDSGRICRKVGDERSWIREAKDRFVRASLRRLQRERLVVEQFAALLEARNQNRRISRGVCRIYKDTLPVRSARELAAGDRVTLRLADGTGVARMERVDYDEEV